MYKRQIRKPCRAITSNSHALHRARLGACLSQSREAAQSASAAGLLGEVLQVHGGTGQGDELSAWIYSNEQRERHQATWLLVLMRSLPNAKISKFAPNGNSLGTGKSERCLALKAISAIFDRLPKQQSLLPLFALLHIAFPIRRPCIAGSGRRLHRMFCCALLLQPEGTFYPC